MRDRPKNRFDRSTGYPTREDMKWQHEEALELLTDFMNRMDEDAFVKYGIQICNKHGRKHFKTKDDLLTFMQECPKYLRCYFDMHAKGIEYEKTRNANSDTTDS